MKACEIDGERALLERLDAFLEVCATEAANPYERIAALRWKVRVDERNDEICAPNEVQLELAGGGR
jgi:hypothetical protein